MSFFDSSLALVFVVSLFLFVGRVILLGWLTIKKKGPSSNAGMLPAIATVLAWTPPDPEIHVTVTACSCGCTKMVITVESAWDDHAIIHADGGTTMETLRSTLEIAGGQVLSHAPSFRIKEPVFKEN